MSAPVLVKPIAMTQPEACSKPQAARRRKVLLIVPAFNEEKSLPRLLPAMLESAPLLDADILVVDDGSTDKTYEVASRAGVRVLRLPCNLGIGGAVQAGFKYASRYRYAAAVQVDGDGQHPPAEVAKLLEPVLSGRVDVAIGSRFLEEGGFRSSFMRQAGIRVFEGAHRLMLGRRITDSTSGFRAYNADALAFLGKYYPADYPEPEAVALLIRGGFRLEEVPVKMVERGGGRSSITPLRSVYYMVKVLVSVFIRSLP